MKTRQLVCKLIKMRLASSDDSSSSRCSLGHGKAVHSSLYSSFCIQWTDVRVVDRQTY